MDGSEEVSRRGWAELSGEDLFSCEYVFTLEYFVNVHAFRISAMHLMAHFADAGSYESIAVLGACYGATNFSPVIYRDVHLSRGVTCVLVPMVQHVRGNARTARGVCVVRVRSVDKDFCYSSKLSKHIRSAQHLFARQGEG